MSPGRYSRQSSSRDRRFRRRSRSGSRSRDKHQSSSSRHLYSKAFKIAPSFLPTHLSSPRYISTNHARNRSRSPLISRYDDLRNGVNHNSRSLRSPVRNRRGEVLNDSEDCRVCGPIDVPLSVHLNTNLHKINVKTVKRGCVKCGIFGFNTHDKYLEHMANFHSNPTDSTKHSSVSSPESIRRCQKQKQNTGRGIDVSCVDDTQAAKISDRLMQTVEEESWPRKVPKEQSPDQAYGIDCITPIEGFYCKICKKFLATKKAAFELHSKTSSHFFAYKRFVVEGNKRRGFLESDLPDVETLEHDENVRETLDQVKTGEDDQCQNDSELVNSLEKCPESNRIESRDHSQSLVPAEKSYESDHDASMKDDLEMPDTPESARDCNSDNEPAEYIDSVEPLQNLCRKICRLNVSQCHK